MDILPAQQAGQLRDDTVDDERHRRKQPGIYREQQGPGNRERQPSLSDYHLRDHRVDLGKKFLRLCLHNPIGRSPDEQPRALSAMVARAAHRRAAGRLTEAARGSWQERLKVLLALDRAERKSVRTRRPSDRAPANMRCLKSLVVCRWAFADAQTWLARPTATRRRWVRRWIRKT